MWENHKDWNLKCTLEGNKKPINNKNITKNCIVQSSTCEKEGEVMWLNNWTWESAILWQNKSSVIFGFIS